MQKLSMKFNHGLGDCVHFVHVLEVYRKHGYDIDVLYEPNKEAIWHMAGISAPTNSNKLFYNPWLYYTGFNYPETTGDWKGSKTALNLNKAPLPKLPIEVGEIWDQVCAVNLSQYRIIKDDCLEKASNLIKNLPKPIILLHTNGTNFQFEKNIPVEITKELYRLLLKENEGSIILLDWDHRIPQLANCRVRHVKKEMGHIDLYQLLAIYELADLLIGVDSGPYHFGAFSDIPTLGVFHHFYPSCVTLPRPQAVNMTRNADTYRPVNFTKRFRWNIVEYSGNFPSAQDIARHAMRLLAGPRYLSRKMIGRDVMMQQWVRDWCRGGGNMTSISDRAETLDYILRCLPLESPVIMETGCTRSPEDWGGAGNSTFLFACYADSTNGTFISVDNSSKNCKFATENISQWKQGTEVVVADSVKFIKDYQGSQLDLLYLDSMDTNVQGFEEHCLREAKAGILKLKNTGFLVIDDTVWDDGGWKGKGAKAIPWLLDNGFELVKMGYQVVLKRRNLISII